MPSTAASAVNQQLLGVPERLVLEYDEYTAGSVLRCFARAAFRARRSGCPAGDLPSSAEAITRRMLAARRPARPAERSPRRQATPPVMARQAS